MNSRRNHKLKTEKVSLEKEKKSFYESNGSHFFHECVELLQTK